MQQLKSGKKLLVAIALAASLVGCRKSKPPVIEICIGDGFGGADCILRDDTKVYKAPSELKNYWLTSQEDMAAFSSWCYDADAIVVKKAMQQIELQIQNK